MKREQAVQSPAQPLVRPSRPLLCQPPVQRQPYVAPQLQQVGSWSAVTLVISLPIGPGSTNMGSLFQHTGD